MLKKKNKIFITPAEKKSGAHFEFRYSWLEENSLYVPVSKDTIFFKEYFKYLEPTETPDGGTKFDGCGINYYTKKQARIIFERIQTDKPKEYMVLLAWLEKFLADSSENGFYILGV